MVLYMQKETQYHDNALPYRKQGLVGRATYGYDGRYFVEGNFGYTGSETFAKGFRFGFFRQWDWHGMSATNLIIRRR